MPKRKCKECKEYVSEFIKLPAGVFCNMDHAIQFANAKAKKTKEKAFKAEERAKRNAAKAWKADTRSRKAEIKPRTGPRGYYNDLQIEVNKYVKHVIHKGKPCYTCGLEQKYTDRPQAFHAGHYKPKKSVDPRRFMLINLRLQCNSCNAHNSGRQGVYREKLIEEIGLDKVEWLECEANHPELKELFPHYSDIQKETARYRKLNKEGIGA